MKDASVEYIDSMIMGNFHERVGAHANQPAARFKNVTDRKERVRDIIMQKLAEKSNNHFLASYLDAPNGIRDLYRMSRTLCREQ